MLKFIDIMRLKAFFAFLLLVALPSYASLEKAKYGQLDEYVDSLVGKVSSVLNNPALSEEKKIEACKGLLTANLDLRWMGRFVLGRHKKELSDSQISDFAQLYSRYVTKTYSDLVKNYKGEKAVVKNVRQLNEGEYIVQTEVIKPDGQPSIRADYLVHEYEEGGKPTFKVADVITEGVSMINSQQSEFGSIIVRDGFEGLMRELKKKIN